MTGTRLRATLEAIEALKQTLEVRIYSKGGDDQDRRHEDLRGSGFKNFALEKMLAMVGKHGFPLHRTGVGAHTVDGTPWRGPSPSSIRAVTGPEPNPSLPRGEVNFSQPADQYYSNLS